MDSGANALSFLLPTFLRQVVALTLLTASGEILECSESVNPELFQAARVHLGCLGVVLNITFQCVPEFHLQETTFPSTLKEVPEGHEGGVLGRGSGHHARLELPLSLGLFCCAQPASFLCYPVCLLCSSFSLSVCLSLAFLHLLP